MIAASTTKHADWIRLDLDGIVAKRKADAYRPETVWYKIKSRTYTQGEGRWELLQKRA